MAKTGRADKPLTGRQEGLITALLQHPTLANAASAANVPESTARRWMRDARFVRAYRDARRQAVEHSATILQAATPAAVAALLRNVGEGAPAAIQLRAAAIILEHAMRAIEMTDYSERVEAVEAELAAIQAQMQQAQAAAARGGMVRRVG